MIKAKKIHKNYFIAVKVLLLLLVIYAVYRQLVSSSRDDWGSFEITNPLLLVPVILLVYPNIGLTFMMWKESLTLAKVPSGPATRVHSFFAGIVTGMLTPNMIGNFLGRLYYYDKAHAPAITALTFYTNFAQFLTSFAFGVLALIMSDTFLGENREQLLPLLIGALVLVTLVYFFPERLIPKNVDRWHLGEVRGLLSGAPRFKFTMLGYSIIRFLVFSSQYLFMLMAFQVKFDVSLVWALWLIYLLTMMAPSLFLGKLGIKESISVFVLSQMGVNAYAVVTTSLFLWFLNTLSPALLGLFICKYKVER